MHLRKREKRKNIIGLTSLIDVIFLLLLFFMLTSTFTKFTEFDLSAATKGQTDPNATKPVFILAMENGSFDIDGTLVGAEDLEQHVGDLTNKGKKSVILAPKDKMNVQRIVAIMERLQKTDLNSVSLAR